jgi:hypothetical protein
VLPGASIAEEQNFDPALPILPTFRHGSGNPVKTLSALSSSYDRCPGRKNFPHLQDDLELITPFT